MHHEAGLTTGDADEAAMKRTLASRAADVYVLASSEAAIPQAMAEIQTILRREHRIPPGKPNDFRIRVDGFSAELQPGRNPAVIVDMHVDAKP